MDVHTHRSGIDLYHVLIQDDDRSFLRKVHASCAALEMNRTSLRRSDEHKTVIGCDAQFTRDIVNALPLDMPELVKAQASLASRKRYATHIP